MMTTAWAQAGAYLPADVAYAMNVCTDTSFLSTDQEFGGTLDLDAGNQGCLVAGERNGTWIQFRVATAGTIGFTLQTSTPTDLDFAVWGPFNEPPPMVDGAPVRCSFAASAGATGLHEPASDLSELAGGDGWVADLDVQAGEVYVIYAMNFSVNGFAVELTWQLANGASLECMLPPLTAFSASASTIQPGGTVSFTDQTEGSPFAWEWAFQGATPPGSSDQNPTDVLYTTPGCYDVSLTAFNAAGQQTLNTTCQVLVELSTGVDGNSGEHFLFLPGRGHLLVTAADGSSFMAEVYNVLGELVQVVQARGAAELHRLPEGPIVVRIQQPAGTFARKVIVR